MDIKTAVHDQELKYFGDTVTLWVGLGNETTITGILETTHFEFDESGAVISAVSLNFQAKTSDIGALKNNDTIAVGGVNYTVNEVQNDGGDWAVILLWRQ